MQNNVKKDYFWNTLGVFMQNAISPLLLIVVTRLNGIYDSGIFSFAFSMAVIFWMISIWGGRTYQVSDINREFPHRSYVMARIVLTILTFVGASIFSWINHYDAMKTSVIMALVLFKSVESIADAVYGVLQVNNRLYIAGKSLTYKALSSFAAFIIIDTATRNILFGSFGIIACNIAILFMYDVRKAKRLDTISIVPREIPQVARGAITILKRTWPIFAVIFLSLFSLNIPRYFIDLYHSEQIGYFGILAMPITLISLVMTFILQPKVVPLSELYNEKKYSEFRKTVRGLISITGAIGLTILIAAAIIGVPMLNIVFGITFSSYQPSLVVMVVGGVMSAFISLFINILTIIRRFKEQFFILLVSNVLLAVCSAFFVKVYGLQGGVTLFTLTTITQTILLVIAYQVTLMNRAKRER